jgi:hypothetical protein
MSDIDLGMLPQGQPIFFHDRVLGDSNPTDTYEFTVGHKTRLSLSLDDQPGGMNPDLKLYQDNGNGIFDSGDRLIAAATVLANGDETLDRSLAAGTYFAQVQKNGFGFGSYNFGIAIARNTTEINETPLSFDNQVVTATAPYYAVQFTLNESRIFHANLHDISAGDNLDLKLYRDDNHNGIFDVADVNVGADDRSTALVNDSTHTGHHDESINMLLNSGLYFLRVERVSGVGDASYDLDLATTGTDGSAKSSPLLSQEVYVHLPGDPTRTITRSFAGGILSSNTTDTYFFRNHSGSGNTHEIDILLSGLDTDADLRLIRDNNDNRIFDLGDTVYNSKNRGLGSETLSIDIAGDYFLQVNQYSSSYLNAYQISFESNYTIG